MFFAFKISAKFAQKKEGYLPIALQSEKICDGTKKVMLQMYTNY